VTTIVSVGPTHHHLRVKTSLSLYRFVTIKDTNSEYKFLKNYLFSAVYVIVLIYPAFSCDTAAFLVSITVYNS